MFCSCRSFWFFRRNLFNDVSPGKILHSNSFGSPSIFNLLLQDLTFFSSTRWNLNKLVLLPLLSIHQWPFVGGPRNLFPVAGWDTMLVQTLIHRAVWISCLLRRNFPETREVQIHRLRLAAADPSFRLLSWTLFDMEHCFLIGSERKLLKMAAGKHWEIHDVWQTKKMIPLITCEVSSGQHVCELVLGVNIFDFGSWGPKWFCQTTNPARLCEFLTRVSLMDFCP